MTCCQEALVPRDQVALAYDCMRRGLVSIVIWVNVERQCLTPPLFICFNRYINHSCSPNCITEVVTVEKENKIIISSCRRIQRGEEVPPHLSPVSQSVILLVIYTGCV